MTQLARIVGIAALVVLALAMPRIVTAQAVAPYAIDLPPWFVETFLDFRDDVAEATKARKRLLVYFGQDGCPYCKLLMATNFSQRAIVDKTRRHFLTVAVNIWGDRETTWLDGATITEKALARRLNVQFTPTLLFFDERGKVVARLDGYYPPHRFDAVLDYVAGRHERSMTLAAWLAKQPREAASPTLQDEPFFVRAPYDLTRRAGAKPLAVIFETPYCSGCDELHRVAFKRAEIQALLARFDVARFAPFPPTELTAPDGRKLQASAWAVELGVTYTPTIIFFDTTGAEAFRMDAYFRPFHIASALDYVASGAFRSEPSFQRFVQARAERKRAAGERVDLLE
jgi:thioredoxin-related protein